jgi:AcrR family transcriptional regulator
MDSQVKAGAEPRPPLSRDRVLHAAINLADNGGIEALTMRKLAQELGVEAMSLYYYVANKDELLAGILDLVVSEMEPPSSGTDWAAAMRTSAMSSYRALLRHRWAVRLLMSSTRVSPARLRWMEGILRCLREGGFSANMTHHAYHALESHIMGFTLWVTSLPFKAEELADIGATFLRELPIEEYPYLAEHIEQHINPSEHEEKSEFEFGLDLILDGLERMRKIDY